MCIRQKITKHLKTFKNAKYYEENLYTLVQLCKVGNNKNVIRLYRDFNVVDFLKSKQTEWLERIFEKQKEAK